MISALLVAFVVASSAAHALNPFDFEGAHGVGAGWRSFPGTAAGVSATVKAGVLHLEVIDGAAVTACTEYMMPVSDQVLVRGSMRTQGVATSQGWQGARVMVYFFDAQGNRLKGEDTRPLLAKAVGDHDWIMFSQNVPVPEKATHARMCAELIGASAGSAWFKDLELAPPFQQAQAEN